MNICEGLCYALFATLATLIVGLPASIFACRKMSVGAFAGNVVPYQFPVLEMGLFILVLFGMELILSVWTIRRQKKQSLIDGELFYGVLPRTDAFQGKDLHEVTYPELAQGILDVDTAGWAEPWEVLRKRILEGFTAIAENLERSGGGNAIVVSHGMTIATFAWLIDSSVEHPSLDNGSVTVVAYENGKFTLEALGDMTYRQVGREIIEKENGKK